jgi:hypothetical protein
MNPIVIENLSQILIVFFLFVLVISGNYIGELLPCKIQKIMTESIIVKHFFGYLTILFLVLLTIPDIQKMFNILYLPFFGLMCYLFFVIIAKTHYKLWLLIITLISIIFILSLFKKNEYDIMSINKINFIQEILTIGILFLAIFGVIAYYNEKKMEYKKKFSIINFFLGTIGCKNNKSFTYF